MRGVVVVVKRLCPPQSPEKDACRVCLVKISSASKVANPNHFRYFDMCTNQPDRSPLLSSFLSFCLRFFRSRIQLQLEIIFLRKQLEIPARTSTRPRPRPSNRIFFSVMTDYAESRHKPDVFSSWKETLLVFSGCNHPMMQTRLQPQGHKMKKSYLQLGEDTPLCLTTGICIRTSWSRKSAAE